MALSPQWLDELRSRVTLSSVVMRTTKLQKAGREWKACCPFHNEKSPSFTVSDEKGFYHCFGCGAHGDVIRWMTDQRGLSFMDAVKELASGAGMEVPRLDPREAQRAEERAGLHDVMAAAQEWFVQNLSAPVGAKAREYLKTRGFNERTIERFGFGYAPDSRTAMKQALSQFDDAMLIEAGLRILVDDKDPYDRFRDRLMLPIQDARGRVIAFGGRILDKEKKDAPKYLNSPDTPLFDKGRTLYNLNRAGPASRQSSRIVVVEGYMDVIALAAAGIEDAVAPMGTALTEQQIELLWRLEEKPVLCFDGDAAGKRAAMRAATRALPMLRPGHSLQFVGLPGGMDPDDLLKAKGRAAMDSLLAEPTGLLDTLWAHERDASPLTSPEDKAGLKARLIEHTEAIQDTDIRSLYRRDLMDRFSAFAFPRREPAKREYGNRNKPFGRNPAIPSREGASEELRRTAKSNRRDTLAQAVVAGLVRHPDQIARHAEALLGLSSHEPKLAGAIETLIELSDTLEAGRSRTISASGIQTPPPDAPYSFLVEGTDPQAAREELAEAVALLVEKPALEAAIAAATARFDADPEGAFAEQQRLRERKLEIESRLGHMARKRAAAAALQDQASGTDSTGPDEKEMG
ncbi:DNA primase [Altererythrobacter sp. Root672]|uniref:DNA primase n=1 Tax=Altererythrobacter sp. Root672 TaxID=1736584 RepID=UPI0006F979B2|nr:DNA primase [Altererythrobacter sp. Root672]KRA83412.1 DNA primase [Altererythrobacter sp. Root672]